MAERTVAGSVARHLVELLRERGDWVERLVDLDPLEAAANLGVPVHSYLIALAELAARGYIEVVESRPSLELARAVAEAMARLDYAALGSRLQPQWYLALLRVLARLGGAQEAAATLATAPPRPQDDAGAVILYHRVASLERLLLSSTCASLRTLAERGGARAAELGGLAARLQALLSARLVLALLSASPTAPAWLGDAYEEQLVERVREAYGDAAAEEAREAARLARRIYEISSLLQSASRTGADALRAAARLCEG